MHMLNYESLKQRQREERETHPEGLGLRVHRSLSWLERSEKCSDDDGRFIFLWIAFNAAYAQSIDVDEHIDTQVAFGRFLEKLTALDANNVLYNLIWTEYSSSIRLLLDNQYVFKPFWDYKNGILTEEQWQQKFNSSKLFVNKALGRQKTVDILRVVLSRMYTLRNQLIHGGSTWNSAVNREQIKDCTAFLSKLVPFIIQLMLDNPKEVWGEALYPPV